MKCVLSELPKPVETTPKPTPPPVTVIETKPPAVITPKPEIKPSKPVVKQNKPLSSVVQVMASSPQSEQAKLAKTQGSPKVHIVSSQVDSQSDEGKSVEHLKHHGSKKVTVAKVDKEDKMIVHPQIISSHGDSQEVTPSIIVHHEVKKPEAGSSVVEVHASEDLEPVLPVENNINDPEYEFLSRQPSEFAEETFRLHNIKSPNSKYLQKSRTVTDGGVAPAPKKPHANRAHKHEDTHPTGLVTKLGGTVVKDGVTTVHETSVIGTYISGKYAQVLQSSSHIYHGSGNKPKIAASPSLRILKTAAPHIPKKPHVIEPTPTKSNIATSSSDGNDDLHVDEIYGSSPKQNLVRASRRPAVSSNTFKNRFRSNRPLYKDDAEYQDVSSVTPETPSTSTTPGLKKPRHQNKPMKR